MTRRPSSRARACLVLLIVLAGAACRPSVGNPNRYCERDGDCAAGEVCAAGRCAASFSGCGDGGCPDLGRDLGVGHDDGGDGGGPGGCDGGADCTPDVPICGATSRCECNGEGNLDTCRADGRVCTLDPRPSGLRACGDCTATAQCPADSCCSRTTRRCVTTRWRRIEAQGGPPPARYQHAAIFDPDHDRMLVIGGRRSGDMRFDDVWELRLGPRPVWSPLAAKVPTPRASLAAARDPARGRALFVGGSVENDADPSVLALGLTPSPTWTKPVLAPALPWRAAATLTHDPARDRLILVAGYGRGNPAAYDEVWALAPDPLGWTELVADGARPAPRGQHVAVYDAAADELVIFGGYDMAGATLTDTWALSLGKQPVTWRKLDTQGTRPVSGDGVSAVLDPALRRVVVFGGITYGGMNGGRVGSNQLTYLPLADAMPTWTRLEPVGGDKPPGRDRHSAVVDTRRDEMIIFGGDQDAPRDDAWALPLPACM